MSTGIHQSAVKRLTKERADLESDKSALRKKIAGLTKDIGALRQGIAWTTSESTRRSKQRQLESKETEYARTQQKLADVEGKLAGKLADLDRHLKAVERGQAQAEQRQERNDQERRREELRHARAVTREIEHQAQLQAQIGGSPLVIDLARLPARITVLFLAANPLNQSALRLDEEHRTIVEKLRASEYRDAVTLVSRWAVRPGDLQQALNEHQPHVVHFSGHGAQDGIVLQGADGAAKLVTNAAIAATLSTGGDNVRAVLFNSCLSSDQAEAVTEHIEVAIGMNDSIGDEAARVFAGQFYSAIGFGRSIQNAFDQAVNELRLHGIPEEHIPELHLRADIDPESLYLVRPHELVDESE